MLASSGESIWAACVVPMGSKQAVPIRITRSACQQTLTLSCIVCCSAPRKASAHVRMIACLLMLIFLIPFLFIFASRVRRGKSVKRTRAFPLAVHQLSHRTWLSLFTAEWQLVARCFSAVPHEKIGGCECGCVPCSAFQGSETRQFHECLRVRFYQYHIAGLG